MTDEVKDVEKKTAEVVAVPATAGEVVTGEKQGAKCCEFCVEIDRSHGGSSLSNRFVEWFLTIFFPRINILQSDAAAITVAPSSFRPAS